MNLKLKALTLGVLAAMSIAAFAAANASATVSGHFVSDAIDGHTIVAQESSVGSSHQFVISIDGGTGIVCERFSAFGTAASNTVTEVEGTTEAKGCRTEGSEVTMAIHMNECKGKG